MSAQPGNRLLAALLDHVVVFDGAMGTELYKRHFFVNTSFDGLCLSAPDIVSGIHANYREAGAEVLTTNTYGANFNNLSRFGLHDKVRDINVRAVELARAAGGDGVIVAGSVGPLGETPYDAQLGDERRADMLAEQVETLLAAGVDFILFETLASRRDAFLAVSAASRFVSLAYVLSFSVDRQGESASGEALAQILQPAREAEVPPTALGLNCGEGPESSLSALELLVKQADYPVIVQPNAGIPKHVEGRTLYMTSPEYFTTYALRYIDLGARGVGGCCGTSPEHIRELARGIKPSPHPRSPTRCA
jgi:homocysteine S-methyltransferase